MILKVNGERVIEINPSTIRCYIWHNPIWFVGLCEIIFLSLSGTLAAAHIDLPGWLAWVVLFLSSTFRNLTNYLEARPPPKLSPADVQIP